MLAEDADRDGVSNLLEILSGHFPGDSNDRPSAAELESANSKLSEFARFRKSYPWKPFEAVERPKLPAVRNSAWGRNPIDTFIAAEPESLGLLPRPEAPKHVLLRRLCLDLIGLPPTPEQLHAFLK